MKDRERMREIVLYIVFGVLTTLVNWAVYYVMRRLTGLQTLDTHSAQYHLKGNVCNITAWFLSVLFAFVTNKKYVFQSTGTDRKKRWTELGLFFASRLTSYLIFDLLLYNVLLFVMNDLWDKLIVNVLVIIFNYAASKWVVFRKKK